MVEEDKMSDKEVLVTVLFIFLLGVFIGSLTTTFFTTNKFNYIKINNIIETSQKLCKQNDGVKIIDFDFTNYNVECNNDARFFEVKYKE